LASQSNLIAQRRCTNLSRPVGQLSPLSTGWLRSAKQRPPEGGQVLLYRGNRPCLGRVYILSSSRAAGGAALSISDVESGDLLSAQSFPLRLPPHWLCIQDRSHIARPFPCRECLTGMPFRLTVHQPFGGSMLSGNGVVDQVSRSLRLLQPPLKLFSVALSTMATHSSQFKTEERRNISHLQCVILACG
jgi:hypothetical protein